MFARAKDRWFHDAFLLAVVLKGLGGVIEIAAGCILVFTDEFSDIAFFLARNQLIQDPEDHLASHLRQFASLSHEAFVFAGAYLIAHGLLKLFISGALWRNYAWAYPVAIVFLLLFIFYEVVRIAQTDFLPLICLAVFDIIMLSLVAHEYKRQPHRA